MIDRFVIMGVSGCGKSEVGLAFANAINAASIDGDDLHPPANVAKMASGQPLTNADRAVWLTRVGEALHGQKGAIVIACRALKRKYLDTIRSKAETDVMFLHLENSHSVIASRMSTRTGHFMPPTLLNSQFDALEPPGPKELSVTANIDKAPVAIVAELVSKIGGDLK